MMGHRQVEQAALFYEFSLERHVPPDHLLRSIDRFVALDEVRRELAPFYSTMGRPSVDPELMIRMLIVAIASPSAPNGGCARKSTSIWRIDGSAGSGSMAKYRTTPRSRRTGMAASARAICCGGCSSETVLQRCVGEGLVGGEGFAVDASLIRADANRQKGIEGDKGLPPDAGGRAVEEYLAVLDNAAFGAATEVTPKFVSPADPAARWTGAHGGQAFFAYSTNYLIDVEHAIIVDVEATTAIRQAEVPGRQAHDRALDGSLRPLSRPAHGRQRLWLGRDAWLAGP